MADSSRRDRAPRWMPGGLSARSHVSVASPDGDEAVGDDAANAAEITARMAPVGADVPAAGRPVELFGWTKSKNGAWVRTHPAAPTEEPPSDAEPTADEPEAGDTVVATSVTPGGPKPAEPAAAGVTKDAAAAEPAPARKPGPPPPPDDEEPVTTPDKGTSEPIEEPEMVEEVPDATPEPQVTAPVEQPPATPEPEIGPAVQPLNEAELMAAPMALVPPASTPVVVTPRPLPAPSARKPAPKPAPSKQGQRSSSHRSRHARLRISHIGIGSLMRTALMFSVAVAIVLFVATAIVWMIVDNSGLLSQAQSIVDDVVGAGGTSGLQISAYLDTQRVLGFAALVSVLNIVLLTLLAGIFGALYNAVASVLGGILVTLSED